MTSVSSTSERDNVFLDRGCGSHTGSVGNVFLLRSLTLGRGLSIIFNTVYIDFSAVFSFCISVAPSFKVGSFEQPLVQLQ